MEQSQKANFLRDEYLLLQNQYEDYDKRSLTIKGWVASGAIVALALGFNNAYRLDYMIPIIVALIVMSVWYLEAYWKLFQYALRIRIEVLEAHFRNDPESLYPDPDPFQMYRWWFKGYRRIVPIRKGQAEASVPRYALARAGLQPFVMIPYLPICVICLASFVILLIE